VVTHLFKRGISDILSRVEKLICRRKDNSQLRARIRYVLQNMA